MKVETILTIAAQCDRAARDGTNEDNCLVVSPVGCENHTVNHFGDVAGFSEVVSLRDRGCLLVVADGMGGMNAGEEASHIAVTTLAKYFSETGLKNVELTDNAIRKFLRKSIVAADDAIKKVAAKDKEKEGMGTTVVLLWILPDNTAYYAWCGDSRLYRYTPDSGLQTLTRDHSYVMEVLHLSEEESFFHPDNNIITRSLGNPLEKANPEIEGPLRIYKDDLFLLCSDGLCGVLPSRKTEGDASCIEDVLEKAVSDADHLIDGINELWTAAAAAGWHDNVTTLLCQVKKGPERPEAEKKPKAMQTDKSDTSAPPSVSAAHSEKVNEKKHGRKDTIIALLVVALVFAGAGGWFFKNYRPENPSPNKLPQQEVQQKTSDPDKYPPEEVAKTASNWQAADNSDVSGQSVNYAKGSQGQGTKPAASAQVTAKQDTTVKLDFSGKNNTGKQKTGNTSVTKQEDLRSTGDSNRESGNPQTTVKKTHEG